MLKTIVNMKFKPHIQYTTQNLTFVILVQLNLTIKLSSVSKKKKKKPLNVTKVWSDVILVLPNMTMELSNVRKKIGYH